MMTYVKGLKKIKILLMSLFLTVFLLSSMLPVSQVFSERRLVKPEWVMPEHYPKWFHGWGRIGYFEGNELVINDFDYRVSPHATFHTPDDNYANRYIFTPGKLAGFLFDKDDIIISVWLITMED
jgi:hypothetical protein